MTPPLQNSATIYAEISKSIPRKNDSVRIGNNFTLIRRHLNVSEIKPRYCLWNESQMVFDEPIYDVNLFGERCYFNINRYTIKVPSGEITSEIVEYPDKNAKEQLKFDSVVGNSFNMLTDAFKEMSMSVDVPQPV
jgi:hypothetical protein